MKFLVLLLILSGCGKRIVYTNPEMPSNQASSSVKSEIDEELIRLEKDFKDIDVEIDLQRIPVVVAPLPHGVVGRCQYGKRNTGIFIILSPVLFPNAGTMFPLDHDVFEKDFVRVLLHEIGHCYFKREHEKPLFLENPGHSFELRHEGRAVLFDRIPRSLMPAESAYRMPKALRSFYVAEIARKADLDSPEVLAQFAEYEIVNNSHDFKEDQTPVTSNTVEPTEENRR